MVDRVDRADRDRSELARVARSGAHRGASEAGGSDPEGSEAPNSEIRNVEANGPLRSLHIATRLRGAEAERALVTVTSWTGQVLFEGALGADGTVKMALPAKQACTESNTVHVLLETSRWHRQADVVLVAGVAVTEHAFA
jgi:hypothetical protein